MLAFWIRASRLGLQSDLLFGVVTEIHNLQLDQHPYHSSTIRTLDQDFPVALVRNSIKVVGSHYGRHRQLSL
jgi:hypothetical protein